MSEFSELIKKFDKIRDYMRDFYVYGFKSREAYDKKSLRSYDNEKRRIESYLSEYMSFRREANGKNVFLSVDSSDIPSNPLYRAFKAKSFTKNDITLHFLILDILQEGVELSATEIADSITEGYLSDFEAPTFLDLSTVRNKLSEYEKLGILQSEKEGKKLQYKRRPTEIELTALGKELGEALTFFSEISPLGVVGSFLLDKCQYDNTYLSFKHHYIMHALESEIVYDIVNAIEGQEKVKLTNHSPRAQNEVAIEVVPLRVAISVQGGRRYLCAYHCRFKHVMMYRLDYIKSVQVLEKVEKEHYKEYRRQAEELLNHTWGMSFQNVRSLQWLRMTVYIPHTERFIVQRIEREGRHGKLTQMDDTTYEYGIEVYDVMEMMPWIRTFIGRIIGLESSNTEFVQTFYGDLDIMAGLYEGGALDDIQ